MNGRGGEEGEHSRFGLTKRRGGEESVYTIFV
jgi:hypothetical protein